MEIKQGITYYDKILRICLIFATFASSTTLLFIQLAAASVFDFWSQSLLDRLGAFNIALHLFNLDRLL